VAELDGSWKVERASGVLPPMAGVRKRIDGSRGDTRLGPIRAPFVVEGRSFRYRALLWGLVDHLEPDGDEYRGRATYLGRELGRFRLRRDEEE